MSQLKNVPIGLAASVGIFLVSAVVACVHGDPASIAALMVLAGIVVNAIQSYVNRVAQAEKADTIEKKVENNTVITARTAETVTAIQTNTEGGASDTKQVVAAAKNATTAMEGTVEFLTKAAAASAQRKGVTQ